MSKIYIIDTNDTSKIQIDTNSNYCTAMNKAFERRFGRPAVANAKADESKSDLIVEPATASATEPAVAQPAIAVAEPIVPCKVYRKNKVIIAITMIIAVLALAVAVISYLNIEALKNYMAYFASSSMSGMISGLLGGELEIMGLLSTALMLGSLVFAVLSIVVGIIALGVEKRLIYIIVPLLGVLLAVASAVVFIIASVADLGFVEVINPLNKGGIGVATYITIGLGLIATIVSIFSYKKIA